MSSDCLSLEMLLLEIEDLISTSICHLGGPLGDSLSPLAAARPSSPTGGSHLAREADVPRKPDSDSSPVSRPCTESAEQGQKSCHSSLVKFTSMSLKVTSV